MRRHSIANPGLVFHGQNKSQGKFGLGPGISSIARHLLVTLALVLISTRIYGQEAHRMSMASEEAAQAEKKASNPDDYNLELGPVSLRIQAGASVEFNDNPLFSQHYPQSDFAFRPDVSIAAYWPVTEENSLYFQTTAGYVEYLKTSSLNRAFVTPDSNLSFKMYAGDFAFDYHDRFSVTQDVTQNPTATGAGFDQIENIIGVGVTWDLDKLILSFGYDHDTVVTTTAGFSYLNNNSDTFYCQAAFVLTTTSRLGLEVGGGLTYYTLPVLNNNTHEDIGPFYRAQLSEYISTKLSAGYAAYQFTQTGITNGPSKLNTFYADLSMDHQLNRWLHYTLSAGRQIQLGLSSDTVDYYYGRLMANWDLVRHLGMQTSFSFEDGSESSGLEEHFTLYQAGCNLTYQITKRIQTAAEYDLALKHSDLPNLGYLQNRLVLSANYTF